MKMIVLNFDNYRQKTITSSITSRWIQYDRIKLNKKYWTPFCKRSVFNDNGREIGIWIGYVVIVIYFVILIAQLYLVVLYGNPVGYAGVFIASVFGFVIMYMWKKLEENV